MLKPRYYYSDTRYEGMSKCLFDDNGYLIDFKDPLSVQRKTKLTICGIWDTEKNTMSFGYAKCSPNDQFVKKIGRELAYNRALEKPIVIVYISENEYVSDVFINNALTLEDKIMNKSSNN